MKRLILTLLLVVGMIAPTFAQTGATMSGSGDSVSNTSTKYCTANVVGKKPTAVTIQVTRTKKSGTIAGKTFVEASIDGSYWYAIDSVTMTNNTLVFGSSNTKSFVVAAPKNWVYYRTRTTGVGTMYVYLTKDVILVKEY
jgi:hypothetical protein